MSDLDKEELEATRNIGKTADETENEIEKIIQFMIEDNYNISFISSIRSLMALYKTYLSLYNKEKEKSKILELAKIPYLEGEIMAYKENTVSKNKIIEKIEECEEAMNKVKQFNPSTYSGIDTFIYAMAQRNILKSLLEEE